MPWFPKTTGIYTVTINSLSLGILWNVISTWLCYKHNHYLYAVFIHSKWSFLCFCFFHFLPNVFLSFSKRGCTSGLSGCAYVSRSATSTSWALLFNIFMKLLYYFPILIVPSENKTVLVQKMTFHSKQHGHS